MCNSAAGDLPWFGEAYWESTPYGRRRREIEYERDLLILPASSHDCDGSPIRCSVGYEVTKQTGNYLIAATLQRTIKTPNSPMHFV